MPELQRSVRQTRASAAHHVMTLSKCDLLAAETTGRSHRRDTLPLHAPRVDRYAQHEQTIAHFATNKIRHF